MESYISRAPTRIDIAGGTLDIWPIYLLVNGAATINMGIDLYAEAKLNVSSGNRVTLTSVDQKVTRSFSWNEIDSVEIPPALRLHYDALRFFHSLLEEPVPYEIELSSVAKSPAGAGLGGSSALNVAIVSALQAWTGGKKTRENYSDRETLVRVTRDLETRILGVPAGMQDFYGSLYGGLQKISWNVVKHGRKDFQKSTYEGLANRLLLFYSGKSRNSGINNWSMFKGLVDKDPRVCEQFSGISAATEAVSNALDKEDWKSLGAAISDEWKVRKTLAAGITTEEMEEAFRVAHQQSSDIAFKVCGAGGGGCFFVYAPSGDRQLMTKISDSVINAVGVKPLPFSVVPEGVVVKR